MNAPSDRPEAIRFRLESRALPPLRAAVSAHTRCEEAAWALSLAGEAELSPERSASIRTRILSGAYDTVEVVDKVAQRILASGDL